MLCGLSSRKWPEVFLCPVWYLSRWVWRADISLTLALTITPYLNATARNCEDGAEALSWQAASFPQAHVFVGEWLTFQQRNLTKPFLRHLVKVNFNQNRTCWQRRTLTQCDENDVLPSGNFLQSCHEKIRLFFKREGYSTRHLTRLAHDCHCHRRKKKNSKKLF